MPTPAEQAARHVSRVAVLKGGRSLERQVSLRSGARVQDALERLGHEVVAIDAGHDLIAACARRTRRWRSWRCTAATGRTDDPGAARDPRDPLHRVRRPGLRPRDGQGAGQAPDAGGRDSHTRVLRLQRDRLPRPRRRRGPARDRGAARLPDRGQARGPGLGPRHQVRPDGRRRAGALVAAFSYDDKVVLERYVSDATSPSRSWTARPCRSWRRCRRATTSTTSSRATRSAARRSSVPADLPEGATERAQELALRVYELLGCYGFARWT